MLPNVVHAGYVLKKDISQTEWEVKPAVKYRHLFIVYTLSLVELVVKKTQREKERGHPTETICTE